MSKISNFDPSNTDGEEFKRIVSILLNSIVSAINGGLTFSDNFSQNTQSVTFTAANAEVVVNHNIGRIPVGYLVLGNSAAAIVYNSDTAFTTQSIFLKASAPTTATIMLF